MTVSFENLTADTSGSVTTHHVNNVALTAGRLHILAVCANNVAGAPLGPPTISHSATWSLIGGGVTFSNSNRRALYVFRCQPADNVASSNVDVVWPTTVTNSVAIVDMSSSDIYDDADGNGAGCIRQPTTATGSSDTLAVSLGSFAGEDNGTYVAGACQASSTFTPDEAFIELNEAAQSPVGLVTAYATDPQTSIEIVRDSGSQSWAIQAFEIAASDADPPEPMPAGFTYFDGLVEKQVPIHHSQIVLPAGAAPGKFLTVDSNGNLVWDTP